jgi:hypothetical protein
MVLARWPNVAADGTWQWSLTQAPVNASGFAMASNAPLATLAAEPEAWLHGYWAWDWSDSFVQVAHIDPDSHFLTMVRCQ